NKESSNKAGRIKKNSRRPTSKRNQGRAGNRESSQASNLRTRNKVAQVVRASHKPRKVSSRGIKKGAALRIPINLRLPSPDKAPANKRVEMLRSRTNQANNRLLLA